MHLLRNTDAGPIATISHAHPNSVKVLDPRVLLGTVVGAHVNAVVQLPEALLPRIIRLAVVCRYKLELARGWVHQRSIILEY